MKPIAMTCEHSGCGSTEGADYTRLPHEQEPGWEDEPIFLCDEHAKGRLIPEK